MEPFLGGPIFFRGPHFRGAQFSFGGPNSKGTNSVGNPFSMAHVSGGGDREESIFVRSTSCFSTSWTNFLEDQLLGEPFLCGTHFPWVMFLFWGGEGEGIHLDALHFLFPYFR